MVRLKFFLFALLVLGLGLAHLPLVSGNLSARAIEGASAQASAQASVALAEVARALEGRRLVLQGLALNLAASPDVVAAVQPQVMPLPRGRGIRIVEPPLRERFAGLRTATKGLVPEELGDSVVLGLVTERGALYSRAFGKPSADDALDLQALVKAGSKGLEVDAFEAPHFFYSMPVLWSAEGGRPQVVATLVVGAPLVVEAGTLEAAAQRAGAAALGLVKGGTVEFSAGPQQVLAEDALRVIQAGQSGQVVQRGAVRPLLAQLPVKLPILTDGADYLGGRSVLAVGSRRVLEGSPYEIVSVATVSPFMGALADYQQNALFALVGLLGFSLVWMLVMGSGASAAAPAQKREDKPKQEKKGKKGQQVQPVASPAPVSTTAGLLPEPPEPPEASPDDFPFPAAPPPAQPAPDPFGAPAQPDPYGADAFPFPPAPAPDPYGAHPDPYGAAPAADPYGADAFPFPPAQQDVAAASPRRGAYEFENHPTAAYSLQQASDPFAAAVPAEAPAPSFSDYSDYSDSPSEATRVATIPQELLQAAARPVTTETTVPVAAPRPAARTGPAASLAPTPHMGTAAVQMPTQPMPAVMGNSAVPLEEQHFQDVFREFVSTREQCGEPNDGLTYEKFVAKLRKNKEQLVQKYACKTVRFQVYVKEGKAALKATPVKD